jgi:SAM-dependent methyltransferase
LHAVGFVDTPPSPAIEECAFYHAMDLPEVGEVAGEWDLRAGIDDYLGHVAFEGKRVLEVGPASGFVTAHMESKGAEVLAVELPEDHPWDIVPFETLDLDEVARDWSVGMKALRNGFWFVHRVLGLHARLFYGPVSDLPETDVFDVSVLGSVLLHCRDPLGLLTECARRTNERVVVTELSFPDLDATDMPVCRLVPSAENGIWDTWWSFTPSYLVRYLEVMGFGAATVSFHEQRYKTGPMRLFTVVAGRS